MQIDATAGSVPLPSWVESGVHLPKTAGAPTEETYRGAWEAGRTGRDLQRRSTRADRLADPGLKLRKEAAGGSLVQSHLARHIQAARPDWAVAKLFLGGADRPPRGSSSRLRGGWWISLPSRL